MKTNRIFAGALAAALAGSMIAPVAGFAAAGPGASQIDRTGPAPGDGNHSNHALPGRDAGMMSASGENAPTLYSAKQVNELQAAMEAGNRQKVQWILNHPFEGTGPNANS